MNTPNNKRRKQSQEKIKKVFVEMLQTKELSHISVSDICKKAKINRTTFYSNYEDIYALADTMRSEIEAGFQEIYKDELENTYNSNNYLPLFQYIKENQILFRFYFKLGYDNKYKIVSYDRNLARKHFNGEFVDYHCEFFRSGINTIIKMWLDGGCKETPEQMVGIIKAEYKGRPEYFGMKVDYDE